MVLTVDRTRSALMALCRDRSGVTAIEYALIIAFISITVVQLDDFRRYIRQRLLRRDRRPRPTQTGHDRLGLFTYLVGAGEDQRRDCEAERPGGTEVDDEFECGRVLNRKISRLSLPPGCGRYSFRCGEGRRRCWRRRRRAGATANSWPPPRGGDVGRLRCEKRFIVDDERIRHGLS